MPEGHTAAPEFPAKLEKGEKIAFKFSTGWEIGTISGPANHRGYTHSVAYASDPRGEWKWATLTAVTYCNHAQGSQSTRRKTRGTNDVSPWRDGSWLHIVPCESVGE